MSVLERTRTHEDAMDFNVEKGLIHRELPCPQATCTGVLLIGVDKSQADRRIRRCSICRRTKSFRYQTPYEGYKISILENMRLLLHYFPNQTSIVQTAAETGIAAKTVGKVFKEQRQRTSNHLRLSYIANPLGVVNQRAELAADRIPVVECDESLFSHLDGEQVWVFGIYDRGTDEVRAFVVPDRTSATLLAIIQEHVPLGTRIYTDGWASYNPLNELGYEHMVVVHEEGFGAGLHTTNHIESCWAELKRLGNYSRGIQGSGEDAVQTIQEHIDMAIWLRSHKRSNKVDAVCEILRFHYC